MTGVWLLTAATALATSADGLGADSPLAFSDQTSLRRVTPDEQTASLAAKTVVDPKRVDYYELSSPSALPDFASMSPYKSDAVASINYASTSGDFATSRNS